MRGRSIAILCFCAIGIAFAVKILLRERHAPTPPPASVTAPSQAEAPVAPNTSAEPNPLNTPPEQAHTEPAQPLVAAIPAPADVAPRKVNPAQEPQNKPGNSGKHGNQKRVQSSANSGQQPDDPPIARLALSYVGADPMAEEVWMNAINDPQTSAHDRQDLIEDLNEDGFDDPKNLTPDDLPLIESRLALIEDLAPSSIDEVNAAAFAEAYKDLINMHAKVVGQ